MSKSTDDLIRELESSGILNGPAAQPVERSDAAVASPPAEKPSSSSLVFLVVAAILVAVVGALPFGSYALYPFSLFTTLLHESSHALAAVLTGGSVDSLAISPNLSGVTMISGGSEPAIAPAGYLGAALAGAAILAIPLRFARWVLAGLVAVPLAALIFFHPASSFTALWCVVFIAGLGLASWRLGLRLLGFLQIFLAIEIGLNAFRDVTWLLFASGPGSHMQSDATNMSNATFLPPTFWAIAFTVISLVLLAGGVAVMARRDFPGLLRSLPFRRKAQSAPNASG